MQFSQPHSSCSLHWQTAPGTAWGPILSPFGNGWDTECSLFPELRGIQERWIPRASTHSLTLVCVTMPIGIIAVCLLMAVAVIDQPFTFEQTNGSVEREREEQSRNRMREREQQLQAEMQRLEKEFAESVPGGLASGSGREPGQEEDNSWNMWSALSILVFVLLEIWRRDTEPRSLPELSPEDEDSDALGELSRCAELPHHRTLLHFYDRCVRVAGTESSRTKELVEGCADDLLEALRSVCNRDLDMEVEECIGIGSVYENWRVQRPLVCDLIVPFTPPEPYSFQAELRCPEGAAPTELHLGMIRVIRPGEDSSACLCGRTNLGEDMLCLVHGEGTVDKVGPREELLWAATSPYLAKASVIRWFQKALTKAWAKISHKYDFDLSFRDLERPGALRIRFRSGKTVHFNISPVVEFENSDVYFVPLLASNAHPGTIQSNNTSWPFTFAVYEKRFLKLMAKKLPESSCHLMCLQIVSFLHEKQCQLTGASGLTNYHLKTVLLHLLCTRPLADWHHAYLQHCLRDFLSFLEKALLEKRLNHFIIGNASTLASLDIPGVFRSAQPLNLFRGFVTHRAWHRRAQRTLAEMVKNADVLIREYGLECVSKDRSRVRDKAATTHPS